MAEGHPQRPEETSGHQKTQFDESAMMREREAQVFDQVRQDAVELRAGFNALTERLQALEGRVETLEAHAHTPREPDENTGLP